MIKILYNIFMILLIITEGLLSIISIFVVQKNPGLVFGMMMVLLSFLIIQLIRVFKPSTKVTLRVLYYLFHFLLILPFSSTVISMLGEIDSWHIFVDYVFYSPLLLYPTLWIVIIHFDRFFYKKVDSLPTPAPRDMN